MLQFNLAEQTFTADFGSACAPALPGGMSPIDAFYLTLNKCMAASGTGPFVGDDYFRCLLFVPLFGAAEMYFRATISEVVRICPYSQLKAASQQVTLGAAKAFGIDGVSLAIGEHEGLTSKGKISSRTNDILGFNVKASESVQQAVAEFESICHLRHAIVHLNGELLFLNRRELGISVQGRLMLKPSLSTLQDVAGKVANVVRAYNRHLGTELSKRWLDEGFLSGSWKKDKRKFNTLVEVFLSKHDMGSTINSLDLYRSLLANYPAQQRRSRFAV